jgi:thiopeptide-type bacteriocin biosynthesis protein
MAMSQLDGLASAARAWKPRAEDWRAWHIFFQSTDSLDRMLVEGVLPEVRNLGSGIDFFFLRYWENGPHIRARFRGLEDEQFLALGDRLRSCAESIAATAPAVPERPPVGPTESWQNNPQMVRLAPGRTVEIMYEPEFRRYGGRHGLPINEHLFDVSSRLALAIIEKTMGAAERRVSIALTLTATAIAQVVADRRQWAEFLQGMKEQWRSFLPDAAASEEQAQRGFAAAADELRAMVSRDASSSPPQAVAERWRQILAQHFSEMRALAADRLIVHPLTGIPAESPDQLESALQNIMLSQVHMMNNRLGVVPQQEFLFASMLLLALASLDERDLGGGVR